MESLAFLADHSWQEGGNYDGAEGNESHCCTSPWKPVYPNLPNRSKYTWDLTSRHALVLAAIRFPMFARFPFEPPLTVKGAGQPIYGKLFVTGVFVFKMERCR